MEKSIYSGKDAEISLVLAIDFGESKVGLAMADTETKIAFVYGTIPNDKNLLDKLAEIITKEDIQKVIIGIPAYINKAKKEYSGVSLGNKLKNGLGVEVKYQNEMFTTKMAQNNIRERGGKNIAEKDNQEAAKIILRDWLDKA
jgi:putative holliday junction resolvase